MSVYERLGVDTVINAVGPATRLSGGLMREEVAAAMREASQACVEIVDLQAKASEIIASHTGAEAGYVTAGALGCPVARGGRLCGGARSEQDESPTGHHWHEARCADYPQPT